MQLKLFPFLNEKTERNAALKNRVKHHCDEAICKRLGFPGLWKKNRSMPKKGCAESNINTNFSTMPREIPRFNHRAKAFHQFFNIAISHEVKNVRPKTQVRILALSESRPSLPLFHNPSRWTSAFGIHLLELCHNAQNSVPAVASLQMY